MNTKAISIRPFIGTQDFELSRKLYQARSWEKIILGPDMTVFKIQNIAFY